MAARDAAAIVAAEQERGDVPPEEPPPTIVRIEEGEEAAELVAEQLRAAVEAVNKLLSSGLTERALVVLLHDLSGIRKGDLYRLLRCLPDLETFLEDR